jgi:hypothetical protein
MKRDELKCWHSEGHCLFFVLPKGSAGKCEALPVPVVFFQRDLDQEQGPYIGVSPRDHHCSLGRWRRKEPGVAGRAHLVSIADCEA